MALIAGGCLVPFSPRAEGNNGLMRKILQAVTSFGFTACFYRRAVVALHRHIRGCVCVRALASDYVLPGVVLKTNEL